MEKIIKKAYRNLETNPLAWSIPLIDYLEAIEKHRSIFWVIEGLKAIVAESSYNNDITSTYFSWLKLLRKIANKKVLFSIEEFSNLMEIIFNYPPERNILQATISRSFDAEATLLNGNYEGYKKKISYALLTLYRKDDDNEAIKKLIELFPKFV